MASSGLRQFIIITVVITGSIAFDYQIGPYVTFPVVFIMPVALATWWYGRWVGLNVATLMALVRVGGAFTWELQVPNLMTYVITNAVVREIVFVILVLLVDHIARKRNLERNVQVLDGILPICSYCKKIRNQEGDWEQMELYVTRRSEAEFSHSICPDCMQAHYGKYLKKRQQRDR